MHERLDEARPGGGMGGSPEGVVLVVFCIGAVVAVLVTDTPWAGAVQYASPCAIAVGKDGRTLYVAGHTLAGGLRGPGKRRIRRRSPCPCVQRPGLSPGADVLWVAAGEQTAGSWLWMRLGTSSSRPSRSHTPCRRASPTAGPCLYATDSQRRIGDRLDTGAQVCRIPVRREPVAAASRRTVALGGSQPPAEGPADANLVAARSL